MDVHARKEREEVKQKQTDVNKQEDGRPSLKLRVEEEEEFKFLVSTIQGNGDCERDVKKRVQAGWNRWRNMTGILCDRRALV